MNPKELKTEFLQFIKKENLFAKGDQLIVAVSGGVDSVVLCDLCKDAGYDFIMAHCNFHLRGQESERDEEFVTKLAEKYAVPLLVKSFDTRSYAAIQKVSIQVAARELRYQWFSELSKGSPGMGDKDSEQKNNPPVWILTAHHLDDNIETMLLNFFRGTGISGLRGMLPRTGKILRPLLFASKERLKEYASQHQLQYVEDSSNLEDKYTRNFIRLNILPVLEKVYPGIGGNLAGNLQRFREVESIYQEALNQKKRKLVTISGNQVQIPVESLKHSRIASTLIYEIVKDYGFGAAQLPDILNLLQADSGKYVCSETHRILRNRNWLILSVLKEKGNDWLLLDNSFTEISYEGGRIRWQEYERKISNDPIPDSSVVACLDASLVQFPMVLRKWRAGDYFYPLGLAKKKKLSRFFIDQKLSRQEKEERWVLEMDKKIIWVIGMRIDDRFKVTSKTKKILRFDQLTNPR